MWQATYILTFEPTPTTTVSRSGSHPGDTAIPGMTSLKDVDFQHSSALAQSSNEITILSKIDPKPDSQKVREVTVAPGGTAIPVPSVRPISWGDHDRLSSSLLQLCLIVYNYALQAVWDPWSCPRLHSERTPERIAKLRNLSHMITIKIWEHDGWTEFARSANENRSTQQELLTFSFQYNFRYKFSIICSVSWIINK